MTRWLATVVVAAACGTPERGAAHRELAGTITVDGVSAALARCRPGHDAHVFVEVDTSLGVLRFGDGKLSWNADELACARLDRSWSGGVRSSGAAYFRGTLAFRCGGLVGDLTLDCGGITPQEAGRLSHDRADPAASPPSGSDRRTGPPDRTVR